MIQESPFFYHTRRSYNKKLIQGNISAGIERNMSKGDATDKWSTPGNGSTSYNGRTTGAGHFLGYGKTLDNNIRGDVRQPKLNQCHAQGFYNKKQRPKYQLKNSIGSLRTNPKVQPGSESGLQLRSDPEWLLGSDPQGNSNHMETQPEFIHKPKFYMGHAINNLHLKASMPQTKMVEPSDGTAEISLYHKCADSHTKPYQGESRTKTKKPKKRKSRADKKTSQAY